MSSESMHEIEAVIPVANSATWMRGVGIAFAGSLFVAACAHIALPLYFTPVPLTLQPFAVLLLGLLLAPRLAAATLGAYLLEGAAGLPVFTPGPASVPGLAHLFGPTGGYLLAYPLVALFISFLWRRGARNFMSALLSAAVGNLMILAVGALWLAMLTHANMGAVVTQAIVPFLPGDALKVAMAAGLATGWQRLRLRNSNFPQTK